MPITSVNVSASVFSVAIDPVSNTLAVTGGEDDKAFVWRIQNGETLLQCEGKVMCPDLRGTSPLSCW